MDDSDVRGNSLRDARLDRSVAAFGALDDGGERAYWHSRSPEERLAATELLRQINYGEAATSGRLQRVFEFGTLEFD